MSKRALIVVMLASCGGPSSPRTPTTAPTATPSGASLERIERIARACAQVPETTEVHANATRTGTTWTSRARIGDRDLAIEPAASTCDGAAITSAPATGDRSLDDVVALARKCHQDPAGEIIVTYVAGPNAVLDRAHYLVAFAAAGTSRTFPLPEFVVDPAGKTCQPSPGPHM
jgi:hypothetical protein